MSRRATCGFNINRDVSSTSESFTLQTSEPQRPESRVSRFTRGEQQTRLVRRTARHQEGARTNQEARSRPPPPPGGIITTQAQEYLQSVGPDTWERRSAASFLSLAALSAAVSVMVEVSFSPTSELVASDFPPARARAAENPSRCVR